MKKSEWQKGKQQSCFLTRLGELQACPASIQICSGAHIDYRSRKNIEETRPINILRDFFFEV